MFSCSPSINKLDRLDVLGDGALNWRICTYKDK
jgi:hypothetical protein